MHRRSFIHAVSLSSAALAGCNQIGSPNTGDTERSPGAGENRTPDPDAHINLPDHGWPTGQRDLSASSFNPETPPDTPLELMWTSAPQNWGTRFLTIVDDLLVAVTKHNVIGIDLDEGEQRWRFNGGDFNRTKIINNSPVLTDDVVFVKYGYNAYQPGVASAFVPGRVFALDISTGDPYWEFQTEALASNTSPILVDGEMFLGDFDGYIYAINPTSGEANWQSQLNISDTSNVQLINRFSSLGDKLYIGTGEMNNNQWDEGGVYALNTDTGDESWSTQLDAPAISTPTLANGFVFVATDNGDSAGTVIALNQANGEETWRVDVEALIESNVTADGNRVFIATREALYAFDRASGDEVWQYTMDEISSLITPSDPVIADDSIYLALGNSLLVIDVADGEKIWEYSLDDSEIIMDIGIANNSVYIGTASGYVYVLA